MHILQDIIMNRKIPVLFTFFLSIVFAQDTTVVLTGYSSAFTVDTQNPSVVWGLPNGGETYDSGEIFTGSWTAEDSLFGETPISIFLSPSIGAGFDTLAPYLPNSGTDDIILPDINTGFARFRVTATDYFGNSDADDSDGYIAIGDPGAGLGQDSTLVLTDETPSFVVDTKDPTVEWYAPNGGETFESGGMMSCDWLAADDYFGETPVTILLSESIGSGFEILSDNIANTSPAEIQLPELSTEFARCEITVSDYFGNSANDYSDGYFTIGDADTTSLDDSTAVSFDESGMFIVDTKDPVIDLISPNGGEHYDSGESILVEWTAEDDTFGDEAIDIHIATIIGGYFTPILEDLPNQSPSGLELPQTDRAFVRLRLIASDMFGNSGKDDAEDYFILGDPFGEYNVNEVEDMVIVDWGWGEYQLILIESDALSFLDEGDVMHIVDQNGIISEGCGADSVYGVVSVSSEIYTGPIDEPYAFYTAGSVDYCEEGGELHPGYVEGNPMYFRFRDESSDNEFYRTPVFRSGNGRFGEAFKDTLTFKYFDSNSGTVYDVLETVPFTADSIVGSLSDLFELNVDTESAISMTPDWAVNPYAFQYNASIISGVYTDGEDMAHGGDQIAAFVGNECRGVKTAWEFPPTGQYLFGITVFGNPPVTVVSSFSDDEVFVHSSPGFDLIMDDSRDYDTFNVYRNNVLIASNWQSYYYMDDPATREEYCYRIVLLDDEGNELVTSSEQCVNTDDVSGVIYVDNMQGWNMVGLPVYLEDTNYLNIYPNAQSGTLYSFSGIYQSEDYLEPGRGYLLRFDMSDVTIFSGLEINEITIPVEEGWNIFSGLSTALAPEYLYSFDIIGSGTIYGLDGIYYSPESIDPGRGYWIRANETGEITLISGGVMAKQRVFTNHLEGSNTLDISDGEHTTTLYFGKDVPEEELMSYSLPPIFEGLVFDARFTGDMKYAHESGEIEVVNTAEALTLSYEILIEAGEQMNWVLSSESADYIIEGTGEITVPSAERFVLNRKPVIPIDFALHQNFPNPFNPITTLRYDLPSDALVTLSIYDMLGRKVTQLVNTAQEAGFRLVQWNATDSMGKPVSAGVYLYQIQAGEFVETKKMVLLK